MLLSKSCEYGLRAALYLTALQREGFVSIKDISRDLGISFPFLTKIFQKLTQQGILHSFRGPRGGVALARPAGQIMLVEIVLAIDGPDLFEECVLGLPGCGERQPCPLHDSWAKERDRIRRMFGAESLQSVARRVRKADLRLVALPFVAEEGPGAE